MQLEFSGRYSLKSVKCALTNQNENADPLS